MAKAKFKFQDKTEVILEGKNIEEIMDKFRAMLDEKKSPLVDMKVLTERRVRIGEA